MSSNGGRSQPSQPPTRRLVSGQRDLMSSDRNAQPIQPASRSLIPPPASHRRNSPGPSDDGLRSPDSQERLLSAPPQSHRTRDDHSPATSAPPSGFSSRRTSWSSDRSRDSRAYANPFADSRTFSRRESTISSDDDNVNTQTVSEKYNILPSAGLLLFPEDVENDDYLHNPDPRGKEERDCDLFSKRGLANGGGLIFITLGILTLFIGFPVVTYIQDRNPALRACQTNPDCIHVGKVSLLENVRHSLIDPDTPDSAMSKKDASGNSMKLVFSDEFQSPGRTFYAGDDAYWQAMDIWYGVTRDLEWYDPDAVTTKDGVLQLRFDAYQNHFLNYRSGMIQSWNQMCFKGGRLEASISLPGRGDTIGLWPGFWTMGNLGRAGYAASTEGLWPYSYHDECDFGITPNQSSSDGISSLPGMRLPACTCKGADHPTPGKSRSAPELDALEASMHPVDEKGNMVGHVSQTFQLAPFDLWWQANTEFTEIYDPRITRLNEYHGSSFQQSVSALVNVNNDWYDGKDYQIYAFEYTPGPKGQSTFFVGDEATWKISAKAIGPNGNVGQRVLPEEPMYIIANLGMSRGFSELNFTGLAPLLPATMQIDYIRVYQDASEQSVTCDPPGWETTTYINQHPEVYTNPNLTVWSDADYEWPKNSFMNDC